MNMLGPQANRPAVGGSPTSGGSPGLGASAGALTGALAGSLTGTASPSFAPSQTTQPPNQNQGQPPTLTARTPDGPSFQPGSVLRGQVTGQDEMGNYSLQLGDQTLSAQSATPLDVGQFVQLQMQGEDNGQMTFQLVQTPFTQLDLSSLANNLTGMQIPPSESNLELAQAMVELGVPLTQENFAEMQSLTAMPEGGGPPPPMESRVAAAVFLQQNQIPLTPQNLLTMSQFMADNPQLGQQMMALNGELKKLSKSQDVKVTDLLKDLPEMMEEGALELDPQSAAGKSKPPPKQQLFNLAQQLGIETHLTPYGGGEDPWELLAELKRFRAESEGVLGDAEMTHFLKLLGDLEGNVAAQKLINLARPEQVFGFFYLQFPLFGCNNVEVWIRYKKEDDGRKKVEAEDCALEFLVTTEFMGELFFVVEMQDRALQINVGVESDEVREFVTRYLGVLEDRLELLDWEPLQISCNLRAANGARGLVERTDFALMESCDVQAW